MGIAAAWVATGIGLGGCRKTESPVSQTENPKIQALLGDASIINNDAVIKGALLELSEIPGGSKHLLTFIKQGTFMQFYFSAKALVSSSLKESETTIKQMLADNNKAWERALGLILLGEKSAQKPNNDETAKIIQPFLLTDDSLLQLGAIIGFLRMKRSDVLLSFIQQHQEIPISQKAAFLLKEANLPVLLSRSTTDWVSNTTFQTCFFRYPDLLDELRKDYGVHPQADYIVWDVGCSCGLTTESMRLALLADQDENSQLRLIGTDLSPLAVLYAARGVYPMESPRLIGLGDDDTKELEGFYKYTQRQGLEPTALLERFFVIKDNLYFPRRKPQETTFDWDDITSSYSPIADNSIDIAVYTNVHYQLNHQEQKSAANKLFRKVRPGGKILFIGSTRIPSEGADVFIPLFGQPLKAGKGYLVFQKPF